KDELAEAEMLRVTVGEQGIADGDGEHTVAARRIPIGDTFEEIDARFRHFGAYRYKKVFLGGEVLVQGASGVIAGTGDLGHLQGQQAIGADLLARRLQEQLLAVDEFALLAFAGAHALRFDRSGIQEGANFEPDSNNEQSFEL